MTQKQFCDNLSVNLIKKRRFVRPIYAKTNNKCKLITKNLPVLQQFINFAL